MARCLICIKTPLPSTLNELKINILAGGDCFSPNYFTTGVTVVLLVAAAGVLIRTLLLIAALGVAVGSGVGVTATFTYTVLPTHD